MSTDQVEQIIVALNSIRVALLMLVLISGVALGFFVTRSK